jgi:pterin-4a-carbinolamine dehydratase
VGQKIFVNYRRDPTSGEIARARNIVNVLRANFGDNVFLDTDAITDSEVWPRRLEEAVTQADLVLCVIGTQWLAAVDTYHRRRLDQPDDWVRKELELAQALEKPVIPLLVGGAVLPPPEALPESLRWLGNFQGRKIRDDAFQQDMADFVKVLRGLLRETSTTGILWPVAPALKPLPLTEDQINLIRQELPEWKVEESQILDDPRIPHGTKVELVRVYQFESFLEVMAFMNRAAIHIDAMDHHPRWENVYKTLIVRLTTWDIKHQLSDRDAVLARYLEREYQEHAHRRRSKTPE